MKLFIIIALLSSPVWITLILHIMHMVMMHNIVWNHEKRLEIICEYGHDSDRLSDWRLEHPLGPTCENEREELDTLVHNYIGSYLLFKAEYGGEIDTEYIDKLRSLAEDWRS